MFQYMLDGRYPSRTAANRTAADDEDAVETYVQIGALLRGGGRDLYEAHRLELLKRWTARRPGSRPWAWWLHEASEPRLVIDDPGDRAAAHATTFDMFWRRHHGIPFHGNTNIGEPLLVEAQPAYLRRLDLLTTTEAARLTPAKFEPVHVDVWGQEYTQTSEQEENET